jgi:glucuronoarabinoxylan endo-1,4-beta-xylanase
MTMAKEINDSLGIANYSAYLWWWVADWAAENYPNGLIDANNNVTLDGYIIGQYAKFVRPGYVRVNATYNPQSNVYLTAYKGSGHAVIVALNLGTTSVTQPITLQNGSVETMTPYQTSNATQNMVQLGAIRLSRNAFVYTLPAQSVTTFVH